jgi:hypothetical protein
MAWRPKLLTDLDAFANGLIIAFIAKAIGVAAVGHFVFHVW